MAHKTLVGGTAYEVQGGRTLVGGTGYSIQTGRTLVGGTGYDLSFSNIPPIGTALNDCTWKQIAAVSDAGLAAEYWSVGDTKTITIDGTVRANSFSKVSIDVFILGFDHNSAVEGTNRIHFQLGKSGGALAALVDGYYGQSGYSANGFQMNRSGSTKGGWSGSAMRSTYLGNENTPTAPLSDSLMAALPADLRAVMKPVTKYSDNTGGGSDTASYVTATTDYLFLLSEFEYHGARTRANSAEQNYQMQYDYYKAGNSKVHYRHDDTETAVYAWCRSVSSSSTSAWCSVDSTGNSYTRGGSYSYGVAPGFCV